MEFPEIVNEYPPNWEKIQQLFPATKESHNILMAYDGKIYNPFGAKLRPDLIFHEKIHLEQQENFKRKGGTIDEWWQRYADNIASRIESEAQAYGKQIAFIRQTMGEKKALQALISFSEFLSSAVYGSVITKAAAYEKLRIIYRQYNNKNYLKSI